MVSGARKNCNTHKSIRIIARASTWRVRSDRVPHTHTAPHLEALSPLSPPVPNRRRRRPYWWYRSKNVVDALQYYCIMSKLFAHTRPGAGSRGHACTHGFNVNVLARRACVRPSALCPGSVRLCVCCVYVLSGTQNWIIFGVCP